MEDWVEESEVDRVKSWEEDIRRFQEERDGATSVQWL